MNIFFEIRLVSLVQFFEVRPGKTGPSSPGVIRITISCAAACIVSMTPQYSHLLPPSWKSQISAWLDEDTPSFDYGGFVVGEAPREAFLLGKGSQRAVLAGTPFVDEIFCLLGCT
jgi:hypothetical protein